jgi:quinol monooxygenase YgiN
MVRIVEMDDKITLSTQLEENVGPVIVMNKFSVGPNEVDEFLEVYSSTTAMFNQQPGFISAQLHRGIAGSTTYINYVIWESAVFLDMHSIDQSSSQIWRSFCLIL